MKQGHKACLLIKGQAFLQYVEGYGKMSISS